MGHIRMLLLAFIKVLSPADNIRKSPLAHARPKTDQMNRSLIIIAFYGDVTRRANIPINVPNFLDVHY